MIHNMIGGGGGASLNFSVVGGTSQPTSAAENTIWVNTSTNISGWVFSAIQPTNPTEGMVCFSTDTSSQIFFNALKKNSITVYPKGCTQYVGGAWVHKEFNVYLDGNWKNSRFYLFKDGVHSVLWQYGGNAIDRGEKLAVGAYNLDRLDGYFCCGPIDVTEYNKLYATAVSEFTEGVLFLAVSDKSGYHEYDVEYVAYATTRTTGELSLDISNITGSRYIHISFCGPGVAHVSDVSLGY